jgi:hypothetical protein
MSNVKFVIVKHTWKGRYRALPKLAFETEAAAQEHIAKTIHERYRRRYYIERRELKADDTNERMTCQCCARPILAKSGLIAHHGYERPDIGWQTASCMGARRDPFEVSREALGRMIGGLRNSINAMKEARNKVAAEKAPVTLTYVTYDKRGARTTKTVTFTRETFDEVIRSLLDYRMGYYGDDGKFDGFKRRDLDDRARKIRMQAEYLAEQQVRYDGWKQTHKRDGDLWVGI